MKQRAKKGARKTDAKPTFTMLAIACFDPLEWEKLKLVAADSADLHSSYLEWRIDVERLKIEMQAKGVLITEADMTVDELQNWCERNAVPINSSARSKYAMEKANNLLSEQNSP